MKTQLFRFWLRSANEGWGPVNLLFSGSLQASEKPQLQGPKACRGQESEARGLLEQPLKGSLSIVSHHLGCSGLISARNMNGLTVYLFLPSITVKITVSSVSGSTHGAGWIFIKIFFFFFLPTMFPICCFVPGIWSHAVSDVCLGDGGSLTCHGGGKVVFISWKTFSIQREIPPHSPGCCVRAASKAHHFGGPGEVLSMAGRCCGPELKWKSNLTHVYHLERVFYMYVFLGPQSWKRWPRTSGATHLLQPFGQSICLLTQFTH